MLTQNYLQCLQQIVGYDCGEIKKARGFTLIELLVVRAVMFFRSGRLMKLMKRGFTLIELLVVRGPHWQKGSRWQRASQWLE